MLRPRGQAGEDEDGRFVGPIQGALGRSGRVAPCPDVTTSDVVVKVRASGGRRSVAAPAGARRWSDRQVEAAPAGAVASAASWARIWRPMARRWAASRASASVGGEGMVARPGGSDPAGRSVQIGMEQGQVLCGQRVGREGGRAGERVPRCPEGRRLGEGRSFGVEVEEVQHVVGVGVPIGQGGQVPLGLDRA